MAKKEITKDKTIPLDPRWEKFFIYYAETGNALQSGIKAGFSENYANKLRSRYPDKVNKGLKEAFSDMFLEERHKEQFNAGKLEQITFPLERKGMTPTDKDMLQKVRVFVQLSGDNSISAIQREFRIGYAKASRYIDLLKEDDLSEAEKAELEEGTKLSNQDIKDLLTEVGCQVKRIIPMYGLRHVYFWTPDHIARDKALDKAYKIRGIYAPINTVNVNVDANQLFTDEQKTKTRSAIKGYLGRRNR